MSGDAGAISTVKDQKDQSKLGYLRKSLNGLINYLLPKKINIPEKHAEYQEITVIEEKNAKQKEAALAIEPEIQKPEEPVNRKTKSKTIQKEAHVQEGRETKKPLKPPTELEDKEAAVKEAAFAIEPKILKLEEPVKRKTKSKTRKKEAHVLERRETKKPLKPPKELEYEEAVIKEAAAKEAAIREAAIKEAAARAVAAKEAAREVAAKEVAREAAAKEAAAREVAAKEAAGEAAAKEAAGEAAAREAAAREAAAKEAAAREVAAKEAAGEAAAAREAAAREAAAREVAAKEAAGEAAAREAAAREAAAREAAAREAAAREAAAKEAAAREAAAREAAAREAATKEAAAREAATREAATREAATREAATREAATREAATREAATKEAATREAALKGPAAKEAAKIKALKQAKLQEAAKEAVKEAKFKEAVKEVIKRASKEEGLEEATVKEAAAKEVEVREAATREAAAREAALKGPAAKEAAVKESVKEAIKKEAFTREHDIQIMKESVQREEKAKFTENEPDLNKSRLIQIDKIGSSILSARQGQLSIIPTGIASLDSLIMGGFPAGSLVLMIADAGAGNTEFAYTSAANLFWLKNDLATYDLVKNQLEGYLIKEENLKIPESICYISFSHPKDDIMKELSYAFPPEFLRYWNGKSFFFKDFSSFNSISPTWDIENEWSSTKGIKGDGKLYLLRELISTLESQAPNSLVIIDSLNRLIKACGLEWNDFVSLLEDIQKKSKKWDGLVYLLIGKGIIDKAKEEELMDIADGVLAFRWKEDGFINQQTMQIIKFRGLMPRIAKENIVRFDISVTNTDGFVVTNVKRISGRR